MRYWKDWQVERVISLLVTDCARRGKKNEVSTNFEDVTTDPTAVMAGQSVKIRIVYL